MLHHQATGLDASSPAAAARKLELLTSALHHAEAAADGCPSSLSCAALRATLVLDVLIEGGSLGQDVSAADKGLRFISKLSDPQCKAIAKQFRDAATSCSRALDSPQPYIFEPLITIAEDTHVTFDPCSLVRSLASKRAIG